MKRMCSLKGKRVGGGDRQSEEEAKVQRTRGDARRRPGETVRPFVSSWPRGQTQDAAKNDMASNAYAH